MKKEIPPWITITDVGLGFDGYFFNILISDKKEKVVVDSVDCVKNCLRYYEIAKEVLIKDEFDCEVVYNDVTKHINQYFYFTDILINCSSKEMIEKIADFLIADLSSLK